MIDGAQFQSYFDYLKKVHTLVEDILNKDTRDVATVKLRQLMKESGFNEHTVVDLILMAYAIGRDQGT